MMNRKLRHMNTQYPLGCDLSHMQSLNISDLSTDFKFVYVKATQGASFVDPRFNQLWQQLKADPEKYRGCYIFWDCNYTAQEHIDNIKKLGINFNDPKVLPLVIDIEEQAKGLDAMVAKNKAKYVADLQLLVKLAAELTGRKVMVYSDPSYFKDVLGGVIFENTYLWLAAIQSTPPHVLNGWNKVDFWQYSWTGNKNGEVVVGASMDLNYFMGTIDQLGKL